MQAVVSPGTFAVYDHRATFPGPWELKMKIRLSLAIVLGLALSAAAYAQDPNSAPAAGQYGGGGYSQRGGRGFGGMGMMGRGVTGTVTAVAADHYTVKTFQGEIYTVKFSGNTRIMKMRGGMGGRGMMGGGGMGMGRGMRGNPPEQIKAADIKAGDVIIARGNVDASAKTVDAFGIMQADPQMAQRMQQMAADYGKTWLMGRVTAIDGTRITLMGTQDNAAHTFVVNESTDFRERRNPVTLADVKVGDMVRVNGSVDKGTFTAVSVMVMRMPGGGPYGPGFRKR